MISCRINPTHGHTNSCQWWSLGKVAIKIPLDSRFEQAIWPYNYIALGLHGSEGARFGLVWAVANISSTNYSFFIAIFKFLIFIYVYAIRPS